MSHFICKFHSTTQVIEQAYNNDTKKRSTRCNIVITVCNFQLDKTFVFAFRYIKKNIRFCIVLTVSLSLSGWYPGSGVVLDCID